MSPDDLGLCLPQVRAQGKHVDSELDDLRQAVARLEAEKAALAEKVELEGAERVTVVSSMSHERDFLLRQARFGPAKQRASREGLLLVCLPGLGTIM